MSKGLPENSLAMFVARCEPLPASPTRRNTTSIPRGWLLAIGPHLGRNGRGHSPADPAPSRKQRRPGRGFTLVELLVVTALTTIGFVAIMNLQLGTVQGVGSARGMQGALALSEQVAQTIRQEALRWTPASGAPSTLTDTLFIKYAPETADVGTASDWLIGYQLDGNSGGDLRVPSVGNAPALDAGIRGELGDIDKNYCVHYRLTWLVPNMLLRADIRVSWVRPNANFDAYKSCPVSMGDRLDEVQSVSVPITVLRNVFVRQV